MTSFLTKSPRRVVEIQGIRHSYEQLLCYLNGEKGISDTILNGYLSRFRSKNKVENTWICSSFEFCAIERNQNMEHLVHKLCSFHCLLMPICIANHWVVAQFYPSCHELNIFDSLYDKNVYVEKIFRQFWETVKEVNDWKTDLKVSSKNTPKQSDTSSCGIYCISIIKSLLTGIPLPELDDELEFIRQNILYTILQHEFE